MLAGNFIVHKKLDAKSNKPISSVVIALSLIAFLFLLPILVYAKAQKIFLFESNRRDGSILHVRIFKCVDGMPIRVLFWVTGFTFLFGYFLPAIFILITISKSIVNIRKNQAELPARNVKAVKRVIAYIVMISMFYFICWLPYWCSVLYVSYVDLFESRVIKNLTKRSEPTILLLYFAHIFPYFHAAANWLFYSRMCAQLTTPTNTLSSREYLTERTSTAVDAGLLSTMLAEEPMEEVNSVQLNLETQNNNYSGFHNVTSEIAKQLCDSTKKSSSTGVEGHIRDEIHLLSAEALFLDEKVNETIFACKTKNHCII